MRIDEACRAISDEPWRAELVAAYLPCARRWASHLTWLYPGEDFEPAAMTGLYLAAGSWKSGSAPFMIWLSINIRGQVTTVLRARANRARGFLAPGPASADGEKRRTPPIYLQSFSGEVIDRRLYYLDPEDDA